MMEEEEEINEIDLRLEKYKLMMLEYHTFHEERDSSLNNLAVDLKQDVKTRCHHLRHFMECFQTHPQVLHLLRVIRKSLEAHLQVDPL